jgi:uncharacterized protein YndB with AHSA1/START domain
MAAANPDYADALAGDPREIRIERRVAAPRALVWKAFTQAGHIAPWWGPDGFRTTIQHMDVRPGGEWRFVMHGPDGTDYPNHVRYLEVSEPERLMYLHGDGSGDAQREFHVTLSFEADGPAHTQVVLRSRFASAEARDYVVREVGAIEGGRQTLARLDAYLASGALPD